MLRRKGMLPLRKFQHSSRLATVTTKHDNMYKNFLLTLRIVAHNVKRFYYKNKGLYISTTMVETKFVLPAPSNDWSALKKEIPTVIKCLCSYYICNIYTPRD